MENDCHGFAFRDGAGASRFVGGFTEQGMPRVFDVWRGGILFGTFKVDSVAFGGGREE